MDFMNASNAKKIFVSSLILLASLALILLGGRLLKSKATGSPSVAAASPPRVQPDAEPKLVSSSSDSLDGLCAKLAERLRTPRGEESFEVLEREPLLCPNLEKSSPGEWLPLFNRLTLRGARCSSASWKLREGDSSAPPAASSGASPDARDERPFIVDFTIGEESARVKLPGEPFYFRRGEKSVEEAARLVDSFAALPESFESLVRRAKDSLDSGEWTPSGSRLASVEIVFDAKRKLWRLASDLDASSSFLLSPEAAAAVFKRLYDWQGSKLAASALLEKEQTAKALVRFRDGWRRADAVLADKTKLSKEDSSSAASPSSAIPKTGYLVESPKTRSFTCLNGQVYKNVKIAFVAPDGVDVRHKTGVKFEPFSNLPQFLRDEFDYDENAELEYLKWRTSQGELAAKVLQDREEAAKAAKEALASARVELVAPPRAGRPSPQPDSQSNRLAVIPGSIDFEQMEQRIRRKSNAMIEISDGVLTASKEVDDKLKGACLALEFKNVTRGMLITRKGVKALKESIVVINLPGAVIQGEICCDLLIDSLDLVARDLRVRNVLFVHGELEAVDVKASSLVFVSISSELKALCFYKCSFLNGLGFYDSNVFACFDSSSFGGKRMIRVDGRHKKLRLNLSNSSISSNELIACADVPVSSLAFRLGNRLKASSSKSVGKINFGSQLKIYGNKFSAMSQDSIDALKGSLDVETRENSF